MSTKIPAGAVIKWRGQEYVLLTESAARAVDLREAQSLRAKQRWQLAGEDERKKAGEMLRQSQATPAPKPSPTPETSPPPPSSPALLPQTRQVQASTPAPLSPPSEAKPKPKSAVDWESQDWGKGFFHVARSLGITMAEAQREYDKLMRPS